MMVKFHRCHETTERATESGTSLERQCGVGGAGLRLPIKENIGGVILKRQDSVNRVLKVLVPRLQADLGRRRESGMHNLIQLQTGGKTAFGAPCFRSINRGCLVPPTALQRGRGCSASIRRTAHSMDGSWAPDCRNPFALWIEVGEGVAKG